MKQSFLFRLVQVLIILGMVIGLGLIYLILTNSQMMGWRQLFITMNGDGRGYLSGILAILAVLCCEYIAFLLFRMMCTLGINPFVERNVTALRRMGFAALLAAVFGLSTLLLIPVPLAVLASLPVGMCGLFSLVLSEVFRQAVAFKEENDLTI